MDYAGLILTFTVIAMMMPSAFTIAWSKKEHREDLPILYAGLGISGLTILGAVVESWFLLGLGLASAFGFFIYVVFIYKR